MTSKSDLRIDLKNHRLLLSDLEYELKSRAINERLKQTIDWSKVISVHYFEPIKSLNEMDISEFIAFLTDNYPRIKLLTSRLINGQWIITALRGNETPMVFDVVIVPMLGFDAQRHRVGYGGGYYDKFLSNHHQAYKIGVCFEQGKLIKVPSEVHDVPMDRIITEEHVY